MEEIALSAEIGPTPVPTDDITIGIVTEYLQGLVDPEQSCLTIEINGFAELEQTGFDTGGSARLEILLDETKSLSNNCEQTILYGVAENSSGLVQHFNIFCHIHWLDERYLGRTGKGLFDTIIVNLIGTARRLSDTTFDISLKNSEGVMVGHILGILRFTHTYH